MTDAPAHPDLTAEFDAFYRDSRDRLLLQTFALTGDLTAARSAVRDAFVVTWHHWRKTARLDDPEATVRSQAWRNALRRASVRRTRREESADAEIDSTLTALTALPPVQRKALLLTQLAGTSMEEMGRELALSQEAAERELAAGAAVFAHARGIDSAQIPAALAALAPATHAVRWPRVTIIRRAGAARRRAHTVVGAAVVVAALVVGGAIVTDPSGIRPTLHREPVTEQSVAVDAPQVALPDTALLRTAPVRRTLGGAAWHEGRTHDNAEGNGRVIPCQRKRYTDPRGNAAWVRVFRDGPAGEAGRRVVQTAEASDSPEAAVQAYLTMQHWLAACSPMAASSKQQSAQTQLLGTYDVTGVGNRANLFLLRAHDTSETQLVGLARTGQLTTTIATTSDVPPFEADQQAVADLLGAAVDRLCELPDAGRCAGDQAKIVPVPALPAGSVPTLLSEWDMPSLGEDNGPWSGTRPGQIRGTAGDLGVISCTAISLAGRFDGTPYRGGVVRSIVLPDAGLPLEFGLTQTAAALPARKAADWVAQIRRQIDGCSDTDAGAGTDIDELIRWDHDAQSVTGWRLETKLPDDAAIEYDIAIARAGGAVSVLLFVSVPRARMTDEGFVGLARRAMERLAETAPYRDQRG